MRLRFPASAVRPRASAHAPRKRAGPLSTQRVPYPSLAAQANPFLPRHCSHLAPLSPTAFAPPPRTVSTRPSPVESMPKPSATPSPVMSTGTTLRESAARLARARAGGLEEGPKGLGTLAGGDSDNYIAPVHPIVCACTRAIACLRVRVSIGVCVRSCVLYAFRARALQQAPSLCPSLPSLLVTPRAALPKGPHAPVWVASGEAGAVGPHVRRQVRHRAPLGHRRRLGEGGGGGICKGGFG